MHTSGVRVSMRTDEQTMKNSTTSDALNECCFKARAPLNHFSIFQSPTWLGWLAGWPDRSGVGTPGQSVRASPFRLCWFPL